MKKVLVVLFLAAALFACTKKGAEQSGGGDYLAKVGNSRITQADFDKEMKALPDYAQQMFADPSGKEKFLDEVIKKEMLYQEALKKGVDKDPEIAKKVEDFKKLTVITALLEKEIVSKAKVSDADVKAYYDQHKEELRPTSQIRASHILVKTEAEAEAVLGRLKKGEKFEDIARKESIDKGSAKNGGDLGFFSKGQMVPEFEKAVVSLKTGEISSPVQTKFGYHIIKVTDRKTGPVVEFDKVKDLISQRLSGDKQKEAFDAFVAELKKTYPVDINKAALAKMSQGGEEKGPKAGEPAPSQPAPKEEPKKQAK